MKHRHHHHHRSPFADDTVIQLIQAPGKTNVVQQAKPAPPKPTSDKLIKTEEDLRNEESLFNSQEMAAVVNEAEYSNAEKDALEEQVVTQPSKYTMSLAEW